MPKLREEEYLDSLYAAVSEQKEQEPLLQASKVIKQAQARPTYGELAASSTATSTLLPPATVHLPASATTSLSPVRSGALVGTTTSSSSDVAGQATLHSTPVTKAHARSLSAAAGKAGQRGQLQGLTRLSPAGQLRSTQQGEWGDPAMLDRAAAEGVDVDATVLRKEVDRVIDNVATAEKAWQAANLAAHKAQEVLGTLEQKIRDLQQQEEELSGSVPPKRERLRQVQAWVSEQQAALEQQEQLVGLAQAEAAGAEAELRAAEAELDFLADARQALDATISADVEARREVMAALRLREERAAQGYLARMQREADKLAALQAEQEALKANKIQAAEDAREAAVERLTRSLQRVQRNMERGQQMIAEQQTARKDAVLGLKQSLEKVREEVRRKAVLYQQLQKQRRELRDQEFQELMESGQNPYAVHRARELDATAARQRERMKTRIEARQLEVAVKLAKEEEAFQKQLSAAEKEKEILARFQKEQGVVALEERVEAYMQEHTTSGQAMLDPTGRLPVYPSQAVVAKTHAFGTGHSSEAVLEKVRDKHPDVKPKEMLIPHKYRPDDGSDEDEDDDGFGDDASFDGARSHLGALTERSTITYGTSAFMTSRSKDDKDKEGPDVSGTIAKGKGGWKQLDQKPLTKLERANMDAAKARHKDSIAAPKVMHGKEFGGDAFICTPAVVVFKDFDVGHTYSAKVAATNRSYAKNTYRALEVPPEYGNILEVTAPLPGHLATGVSGEITITFTPKVNEDIETHVSMLAETGPFQIPIRCLCKKAELVASSTEVDFGPGVILGEQVTRTVTLSNQGALQVDFTCSFQDAGDAAAAPGSSCLSSPPFTLTPSTGKLQGYSKVTLTTAFCPATAQPVSRHLLVSYKSQAHRKLVVPPSTIRLTGVGRDLPIFLEREVIDFRCVMVDHVYREKLVVRNGGKTAMKVSVVNRPNVSDYIEFSPDFGFVQAGQVFPITVLFKPRASMLQQCSKYLVDPSSSIFEVPLKLVVPDQKLPVRFTVRAHVTTTDLLFAPPSLDFGPCVMAEDTGVVLRVTNPSALPQTFGFVGLPPAIRVMPNDGFGYILPGKTIERIVSFQPPIPGPQSLSITARSLAGRSFTLPVTAVGVQPSLSLSHNKIAFPATPINDVRSCSVVLTNNTAATQAFEFGVPHDSGLVFIPHVGDVPPAGSKRIQINFQPALEEGPASARTSLDGEQQAADSQAPAAATASGGAAKPPPGRPGLPSVRSQRIKPGNMMEGTTAGSPGIEAVQEGTEEGELPDGYEGWGDDVNAWYSWRNFSVPCFIRPTSARSTSSGGVPPPAHAAGSSGSGEMQVLHLNIVTCAVNPDLVLRSDLTWNHGKRCYELDFGPVPVGQRVTRNIELHNQGYNEVPLSHEPLDHRQVFNVVAAWRSLGGGASRRCLLAFQPQERADYLQMLTIKSPRTQLRIALKGQGIAPQLKLEPADVTTSGLDLGDVAKGESSEARFSITNVCPFPLSWAARFGGVNDPNVQNRQPFFCRPALGTLAQGESREVVVVFQPTQQRPYYQDVLQVLVPNQQEQLHVPLKGRCWEEGIYIAGPDYPTPTEDPFLEHHLAELATTALAKAAASGTAEAAPAALKPSTPDPSADQQQQQQLVLVDIPQRVTPTCIGRPGTPSPMVPPPHGLVPMAPLPSASATVPRKLTLTFPHIIHLGETATVVVDVGSLKSSTYGGATGEVQLDGLTAVTAAAGWAADTTKVALAAGEKKRITIKYKAPSEVHAGMAGLFGHVEHMELQLLATLKGGAPAAPLPDGRKVQLTVRMLLAATPRPDALAPEGVQLATGEDEEPSFRSGQEGKPRRR